jgi:hypothetical protein
MSSPPAALIDVLSGLLEAEQMSLLRSVERSWPHVGRASAEMRQQLQSLAAASVVREAELSAAIQSLGATPVSATRRHPDEPYLAYLSLSFLMPRLARELDLAIERYSSGLAASGDASPDVRGLLERHLADLKAQRSAIGGPSGSPASEPQA